jgi:hypothetical protein
MIAIGLLLIRMLCDCFKPRAQLETEILMLRHQLSLLQQRTPRCVCRKPRPFDLVKESRNVDHHGRAALLPFEVVVFAVQADQLT